MSDFRWLVLDALDDCHENTGGRTPDHIIVAESDYDDLRAEVLSDRDPLSDEGFMGMTMWHSRAVDRRGKRALLLSDEVFKHFFSGMHAVKEL